MKPYLLLLASCSALTLTACKGSIGSPKQPAWLDAQPCQQELPQLVDYTKDQPLGDAGSVIVIERGDGAVNAYVVNPKDGTVGEAYKVNPDDYAQLSNPMGDRIAGSIVRPTPPPPPDGQGHLRYLVGLASRIRQEAPMKCMGIIGPEKPTQLPSATHL
jgi:hypothetical protein